MVHVDLPTTRKLVDARAFAAMKESAILVDVSRGGVVDGAAVTNAMRSGAIAGAALDVFETEPLPAASPFWSHPRVLVTAHSSTTVDRYMDDVFEILLENLRRWVAGERLRNEIDTASLGFERA